MWPVAVLRRAYFELTFLDRFLVGWRNIRMFAAGDTKPPLAIPWLATCMSIASGSAYSVLVADSSRTMLMLNRQLVFGYLSLDSLFCNRHGQKHLS